MAEAELELIQEMYSKYAYRLTAPTDSKQLTCCSLQTRELMHAQVYPERLPRRRPQQGRIGLHRPLRRQVHGRQHQDRREDAGRGCRSWRRRRRGSGLWRLRQMRRTTLEIPVHTESHCENRISHDYARQTIRWTGHSLFIDAYALSEVACRFSVPCHHLPPVFVLVAVPQLRCLRVERRRCVWLSQQTLQAQQDGLDIVHC